MPDSSFIIDLTYPFSDLFSGISGFFHATALLFTSTGGSLLEGIDIFEQLVLVVLKILPIV